MTSTDDFRMQPAEVADATKQLDALASRVEKLMATEGPNLTVTPAARDARRRNRQHRFEGRRVGHGVYRRSVGVAQH